MWIGVAAVAGIALFLYNKNKKSSSGFANLTAKRRATTLTTCGPEDNCSGPAGNLCGESCLNGKCNVAVYDAYGQITYVLNQPCPKMS